MKTNRVVAVVLVLNISLGAMDYKSLKESVELESLNQKTKKEKNAETHETFRKAYRAEFRRVWNDDAVNKKNYEDALKSAWRNLAIVNGTFSEYRFMLLKDSYKETLKKFYPNDPLLHVKNDFRLREQADREARNFVENDTCAGCCWLLCTGV